MGGDRVRDSRRGRREGWWAGLALVAATMSALDGVFTWLGLTVGYVREVNPLLVALIDQTSVVVAMAVRALVGVALVGALYVIATSPTDEAHTSHTPSADPTTPSTRVSARERVAARVALVVATVALSAVTVWHCVLMVRYLSESV